MTDLQSYYQDFMNGIYAGADANQNFKQQQFFEKTIDYLIEDGIVQNPNYHPYQNIGVKIDGYEFDEDRGILNLFICDFEDDFELKSLIRTDIDTSLKRVEKFFMNSLNSEFYKKLEETSEGYSVAEFIYSRQKSFNEINIILLSNKYLSSKVKNVRNVDIGEYKSSYDIWDIDRLYQSESSKGKTEAIEIDFKSDFNTVIPTLPIKTENKSCQSFLCVISGIALAKLYEKHGSKLLEANIRSFLQFKSSINKGIRKTIKETPEMFFAYNNGITATAEEVKTDEHGNIYKLKNLQIVNGGQTTATLYNAQKRDNSDLSKIFVQMKLSIIDPEIINSVVPNISKFANTQNKVSDSDFFANHEFHRRIEEQSRRIWSPRKEGVLKQSKWFYERSRGQYLEQQANLSDSKKKEFGEIYPKIQMFTKIDLGKIFVIFDMFPNHAVKGAQSAFKYFADKIVDKWESGDDQYNDLFYKHAIAKIIIFKACQKIIANDDTFRGQDMAILVAYTLFALLALIERKSLSVDYSNIWEKQDINDVFSNQLKLISVVINRFMHEQTEKIGVTILSYSKTETCIKNLKEKLENKDFLALDENFKDTLIDKNDIKSDIRSAKTEKKMDNGIVAQTRVLSLPPAKWKSIMDEARKKGIATPKELEILSIATQIPKKIPTEKQSLVLIEILEKVLDEGIIAA